MLLLASENLPEDWLFEVKFDGYRAVAIKSSGVPAGNGVQLRSRNDSDFTKRFRPVSQALEALPDETVVDGELVALDEAGKPSFSALQNYSTARVVYYVFDLPILCGRNIMDEPLTKRRALLEERVLPLLFEPIRYSCRLNASLPLLVQSIRAQGLEGLVAKKPDSKYEPGRRSGAWRKMRLNARREFVIGGYTRGAGGFDALVIGRRADGDRLLYVARTRSGFTPALRAQLLTLFAGLETDQCPFDNLPEAHAGRWGQGLTAEKMKDCRWLPPVLIGEFEYVEETPDGHLRHPRFVRMRVSS